MRGEVDDGVQEVFIACFKEGGALQRVDASSGQGFRAFLYGVVRNVALHLERTAARRAARTHPTIDAEIPNEEPSLSRVYDRAYARALMREAADLMAARARESGDAALRRVDILKLRFEEGVPIREIARLWGAKPNELHLEYAKAAREFRAALREVVGLSERCAPDHLDRECERLLQLLG
jgi:RNA polymerase sigma factor (sigma-70 family)